MDPVFSSSYDTISALLTCTWIWSADGSQNNPTSQGWPLHWLHFWLVQITLSISPLLHVCHHVLCINSSLVRTYILNVFPRGSVWILLICYSIFVKLSLIDFCVETCYCLSRSLITICLLPFSTEDKKGINFISCGFVFLGVCVGTSWSGHLSFIAASRILHDMNVLSLQC